MLEKVQADRLTKLEQIRALGIDPYGARYDTAEAIKNVVKRYEDAEAALKSQAGESPATRADESSAPRAGEAPAPQASEQLKPKGITGDAAGRMVLYRDMGKMVFAHIRDQSGAMQIALRKNALDEKSWNLAKLLDLGDIIAVSGPIERTRTGEVTIWADKLTLLVKSLNPMPEKWHGLSDVETRYRRRYLDLMTNPDSLATFQKRIRIIQTFRDILTQRRGFVEVETPILQAIYGGAAARPFTTHHNTLDADLFMRISPELYLKRLLVGGMERVFEIGRNFRNEGIDTRHNPEFTMMELYQAYADYNVMMEITEELVATSAKTISTPALWAQHVAKLREFEANQPDSAGALRDYEQTPLCRAAYVQTQHKVGLPYGEQVVDFTPPWPRRKYADLVKEYAGVDWKDEAACRAKARELKIEESNKDLAVVVNEIFEAVVEPALAKPDANGVLRPTFVIDYPAAICPLTRRDPSDPTVAQRFECFVAGMEIANAYTELNDPAIQEENFRQQLRGEAAGETMRVMDEDFVNALRHGMPPAGGLGIGIDRVIMLLTNSQSIRDVVLFPLLRPE